MLLETLSHRLERIRTVGEQGKHQEGYYMAGNVVNDNI